MALSLKADAYAPEALIDAGIPPRIVRCLMADGPKAVPERPRLSLSGRKRGHLTTAHVWGPDALVLLSEAQQSGWEGM